MLLQKVPRKEDRAIRKRALVLLLFFFSCSSIPKMEGPAPKSVVINSSFNKVWQGMVLVLTKMGCTIRTLDKDTGLIVFSKNLSKKEAKLFTVTPKTFLKKIRRGRVEVNAVVRALGSKKTEITLYSHFHVVTASFASSSEQMVPSSGEFERRFFYILRKLLEGGDYRYLL